MRRPDPTLTLTLASPMRYLCAHPLEHRGFLGALPASLLPGHCTKILSHPAMYSSQSQVRHSFEHRRAHPEACALDQDLARASQPAAGHRHSRPNSPTNADPRPSPNPGTCSSTSRRRRRGRLSCTCFIRTITNVMIIIVVNLIHMAYINH